MGPSIAEALARARGFLLESPGGVNDAGESSSAPARTLRVGVVALTRGSGATTVTRGLAQRFATSGRTEAVVRDFSAPESEHATAAIETSDCVVAVASGTAEPALASLVCSMLGERLGDVLLVANRVLDPDPWADRCVAALPESRLGAFLIHHGRLPGGALGAGLRRLAAAVEQCD